MSDCLGALVNVNANVNVNAFIVNINAIKGRFPIENPGNPGTNLDVGSGGAIPIVNFIKRLAQRLRIIILFHFGLVTFRIHFPKNLFS